MICSKCNLIFGWFQCQMHRSSDDDRDGWAPYVEDSNFSIKPPKHQRTRMMYA